MTTKYVIELGDDVQFVVKVGVTASGNAYSLAEYKADLEELKQDTSYQKGYDAGIIASGFVDESDEAYRRGLNDAWECARKIVTWPDRSLVKSDAFDLDPGENIFTKYSAYRAIEKLKAYEEQQKVDTEIKVGDEVKDRTDDYGVVTWIYGNDIYVLWQDGSTGNYAENELIKTGRHFNFLASLLEAMKEGAK